MKISTGERKMVENTTQIQKTKKYEQLRSGQKIEMNIFTTPTTIKSYPVKTVISVHLIQHFLSLYP